MLFTHFPLAAGVPNTLKNGKEVLAKFAQHNLVIAFGGHHHGFTEKKIGSTILLTGRCCSLKAMNHDKTKEKGYVICRAKDGQVAYEFVEAPA